MDGNLLEQIPTSLPSTLQELKTNENNLREIHKNSFKGMSTKTEATKTVASNTTPGDCVKC